MVDKMDLVLLKQEIVDWYKTALEACELLKQDASTIITPGCLPDIELKTDEAKFAFKLGVILAESQFSTLPFPVELEEDNVDEQN
ncbi:hypothetical protein MIB43_015235 [Providencia rettgeri]|uniref:hypothetical protein n=1 Tax=Providencia rettgeri TaxID=587 RepID=UPI001F04818B|nr:hypothetical protein [Providencia rettgeri]MCG9951271.1 hypothetical protein [Providencia rettgeri]